MYHGQFLLHIAYLQEIWLRMLAYIVDIIFIFSPFYLVIPGGWGTFVKTCTNMPPDEHLRGIHRQNNMFILQTTILNVYLRCLLESKV